jgi:hypothetical protein
MSDYAEYNRLLAEAKIKALEALKRLLLTCNDPIESRRIADAILKATNSKPRKAPPKAAPRFQPAPFPRPVRPPLSPHALGTLHLDAESLTIDAGDGSEATDELRAAPIPLTPRAERTQAGGPGGVRPLPLPLGPPRA